MERTSKGHLFKHIFPFLLDRIFGHIIIMCGPRGVIQNINYVATVWNEKYLRTVL